MRPGVKYCRRNASTSARDGPVYGKGWCGESGRGVRVAAGGPFVGMGGSFAQECCAPRRKGRKGRQDFASFAPWRATLLWLHNRIIALRSPVAEKLPDVADLAYQIEVQVGNHHIIFASFADGQK